MEKLKKFFIKKQIKIQQKKAVIITAFFMMSIISYSIFYVVNMNNKIDMTEDFSRENVEINLVLSQKWFDNSHEKDNILNYIYYPENNQISLDRDIVREMGAFWGYVRLYGFNKNEDSLIQIEEIRRNIQDYIKYDKIEGTEIAYIEFNDIALINTQAFYLLALSELKKEGILLTEREEQDLEKIINGIYLMRAKKGGLWYVYYLPSEKNKISPYGTSETLFGLISYYKYINKDKKVLDFAENIFKEYFEIAQKYSFEKEEARSFHSWILYFLKDLYQIDESYYSYVETIVNNALDYRKNNINCYNSGCLIYKKTISEAGFLEGNIVVYNILREMNYPRIEELKEYIDLAINDIYSMQIRSIEDYYEKTGKSFNGNNEMLIGGFCGGLNDGKFFCETMRSDYTQHSSSALLNYYNIFLFADK